VLITAKTIIQQGMSPAILTCKNRDATHHKNTEDNKLCLTGMAALEQIDKCIY